MSKSSKNNDLIYSLKITLLMAPLLAVPVWLLRFEVPFLGVILGIFLIGVIYALKDRFIYSRLLDRKVTWRETLVLFMVSGVPFFAFLGGTALGLITERWLTLIPILLIGMTPYAFYLDFPYKYLSSKKRGKIFSLLPGKETSVSFRKLLLAIFYGVLSVPGVIVFYRPLLSFMYTHDLAYISSQYARLLAPYIFLLAHSILNSILKVKLFRYEKGDKPRKRLRKILLWFMGFESAILVLAFMLLIYLAISFRNFFGA